MKKNPNFNMENPYQRLYDAFPDMSGSHLVLHAMRAMFPETSDRAIAQCLWMDEERYLSFLDAEKDTLLGDPSTEILSGLVRLAGVVGSPGDVSMAVANAKAITAAALADFPVVQKLVLRAPVYRGIYGYDVAPDLESPFREAFSAAKADPVAAASWMKALPSLLQMAGHDPEELEYALDFVDYIAGRAAFDAAVSNPFHLRMDKAQPGDETWKAAEAFLGAAVDVKDKNPAPFRHIMCDPKPYRGEIHVCVGFYPNGSLVVNHVRHEDLASNVKYNRTFRPGRAYFVDGEWTCGGDVDGKPGEFVRSCMDRIKAMSLPKPEKDSRPYG